MHFSTVSSWLTWIASLHAKEIDLGLERVKKVAESLGVLNPKCVVITVAGTNGKGSTVAGLASIYHSANYNVGSFTSPFLFKHNEQVCINGRFISDEDLCSAFAKVEQARDNIRLTPFEFFTLAALYVFKQQTLDIWILEVGLGGRLDAVNIIDADVAIVTSIGIDHVEFLGHTRETIGFEKAGIFRSGKPAICGDLQPPKTLIQYAKEIGADLYLNGKDFNYQSNQNTWSWFYEDTQYNDLPTNTLATHNMANVLMAVTLLQKRLAISEVAIKQGLTAVRLPGRLQIVPGKVTEIYDVSHNPEAIEWLAQRLQQLPYAGKTYAVFSMLSDKDIVRSLARIKNYIDVWFIAPLHDKRAASLAQLKKACQHAQLKNVMFYSSIKESYDAANRNAEPNDRIVIFGSFHTVVEVGRLNKKINLYI